MSAFAFVSTTRDPSRFPLGPSTPSVQLDEWVSSPDADGATAADAYQKGTNMTPMVAPLGCASTPV